MGLPVTVKGANASTVTVTLTSSLNYSFAQVFAGIVNNATSLVATNYATGLSSVPAGTNELVIAADPGAAVTIPSGYNYITDPLSTPVSISGAGTSGTINVLAGTGGVTYTAGGSESVAIVAGGGTQVFQGSSTGSGSYLVVFDQGPATINAGGAAGTTGQFFTGAGGTTLVTLGAANDTVVSGGTDTISGGTGTDVYFLNGTGSSVTGSSGTSTIIDNGTGDTVTTGTGVSSVFAFGTNGSFTLGGPDLFVGGASPTSITVAAAGSTIFGGSGTESINAGSNAFSFLSGTGAVTVTSTTAETLFGSAGGSVTYNSSVAGGALIAGAGNETLQASGSSFGVALFGGYDSTGSYTLIGNGNGDYLVAGQGFNTLVGGTQSGATDTFEFAKSIVSITGAAQTVTNFAATDFIQLVGYGTTHGVNYTITGGTGGGTIKLSDGTQINITGVTPTDSQIKLT